MIAWAVYWYLLGVITGIVCLVIIVCLIAAIRKKKKE